MADKQRANLVRWFLLGLPWASTGGNARSCRAPKQNKTLRVFAKPVLHLCIAQNVQVGSANCTKRADYVIFMEMLLRNVGSIFSAKHRCFHVNMSAQPVLLNKPEHVSTLLNIPFCRGPGSYREGSGGACELNTSGVLAMLSLQCTAPSLPLALPPRSCGAPPGSPVPFMLFSEVMF